MVNQKPIYGLPKKWLTILMVMFLVYINNKEKIDDQFIFSDIVRLTEPRLPLLDMMGNKIFLKLLFLCIQSGKGISAT